MRAYPDVSALGKDYLVYIKGSGQKGWSFVDGTSASAPVWAGLITLLNDGTLMAIGYDRVVPQPRPQKWNLPALFFIAAVLAGVACVSSLMLLWMTLDSIHAYEDSWFYKMGLPPADYPHIITTIYLKVSISDFLTLFAARTQTKPFFAYGPSMILMLGAVGSLALSTCVAAFWPSSSPDGVHTVGLAQLSEGQPEMASQRLMPIFVWLYCLVWWFIQDWIKCGCYVWMDRFDVFSYRTFMDPDTPAVAPHMKRSGDQASVAEPLMGRRVN